ncbi:NAD(P)/FAD-dependent oxidoreductase [Amycolatopsis sp. VS8301801F10]|uniref:NAD(P)/FAD-dependent oxidoreductase n=1 Tax=Amycolatopsis sp. VS8301801F10 TaxID=2652442 RepID=UPI0038FC6209
MLLARAGYRVLLLERERFPRDTLSTLYIHQPGTALLSRWGVLPAVVATGCPPIEGISYTADGVRLEGRSWPVAGEAAAYAPRRHLLDSILVRAAVAAGAEFRDGARVHDLVFDDGRVAGVRVRSGTADHTERCCLVVGADGMRSTVAAKAGATIDREDPKLSCAYYVFWSSLPQRFRLYETRGSWVGTIPTGDGATLVGAYFPQDSFARVRGDGLGALLRAVEQTAPEVREQMAAGRRLEPLRGTGDQRNFFRQAAGPGWVLVGDSGHHKDSITARGITDAFQQAQLLADCIGEQLADPAALRSALARFARERTALLTPGYQTTLATARLSISGDQLALLRAIARSSALTDRYFSALSGVCPIDEFVTPELIDLLAETG